ncbi:MULTISPECIES: RluA family pseudouridine synthase [unclassified Paenibacillus]|uniref:RluA family pseudouridine synthase n=1 Tax=unclassified Paenibacillus TaxID=185978 RepID=UPI000CFDB49C|nr:MULTISPECIES: RluA family pseudouridine synthase [unclassified Paenibacillus]PRA08915.1 RNA pseudouridine synthase [Paenibacillus sp. MYb63]PRA48849.1 RNA pseudouridine synthase [Paenibacillus sp. MYb67]
MSQYYSPIVYTVTEQEDGWLLKTVLQRRLLVSRKLLSKIKLTEQGVMLNGERVYISVKVAAGDVVEVRMEQEESDDILPEPIPFTVLYEDEHLLVVNKDAGIIVHPTHGHYTGTLANGVVHYWKSKGERFRFRPIHRLDQETSGVLAIAKNPYVHQHVSEQMIAGTVDKKYIALVHGSPVPEQGAVDGPIDRDPEEPHRRIVTPDGYAARTLYTTLTRWAEGSASAISLKLESGRTHQIRVHMTSIGCPLIGDRMYKTLPVHEIDEQTMAIREVRDSWIERQALHACELTFEHPILQERVTFQAPFPADMAALEQRLNDEAAPREEM